MTHDNIALNEKELLKSISMNRIGSSREIANIIYLLTTNYSSYINGANIEVTGGKYLTQI
jgi:NAD(P)-dependent dehydrogenase (short-subunit alcohol dehydrogenase family)